MYSVTIWLDTNSLDTAWELEQMMLNRIAKAYSNKCFTSVMRFNHPVPDEILKSIEKIKRDKEHGNV